LFSSSQSTVEIKALLRGKLKQGAGQCGEMQSNHVTGATVCTFAAAGSAGTGEICRKKVTGNVAKTRTGL